MLTESEINRFKISFLCFYWIQTANVYISLITCRFYWFDTTLIDLKHLQELSQSSSEQCCHIIGAVNPCRPSPEKSTSLASSPHVTGPGIWRIHNLIQFSTPAIPIHFFFLNLISVPYPQASSNSPHCVKWSSWIRTKENKTHYRSSDNIPLQSRRCMPIQPRGTRLKRIIRLLPTVEEIDIRIMNIVACGL